MTWQTTMPGYISPEAAEDEPIHKQLFNRPKRPMSPAMRAMFAQLKRRPSRQEGTEPMEHKMRPFETKERAPGWDDLTAEDRALIRRGGAVGWRKIGDRYVKHYRQPSERSAEPARSTLALRLESMRLQRVAAELDYLGRVYDL
jgi:hypothetical protein